MRIERRLAQCVQPVLGEPRRIVDQQFDRRQPRGSGEDQAGSAGFGQIRRYRHRAIGHYIAGMVNMTQHRPAIGQQTFRNQPPDPPCSAGDDCGSGWSIGHSSRIASDRA